MADQGATDRLQPSLLDRLTDLEPQKTGEARSARVIDIARLREIVRRDLSWLLNANNLETEIDPKRYPNVSASVLNYGVREVSGDFATSDRATEMQDSIRRAIEIFEPRIRPESLKITMRSEVDRTRTSRVVFDIHGEMWAEPMPLELYLRSEIDMTTGDVDLKEAG